MVVLALPSLLLILLAAAPSLGQPSSFDPPASFLNLSLADLEEDFQRNYALKLHSTCEDLGDPRCCSLSVVIAYVNSVGNEGNCAADFPGDSCYRGLTRNLSALNRDKEWDHVPAGFFSPSGYVCIMACTSGAYCPGHKANKAYVIDEASLGSNAMCIDRRRQDQVKVSITPGRVPPGTDPVDINITSYCCSDGTIPFRPSASGFPGKHDNNEDICLAPGAPFCAKGLRSDCEGPCPAGYYCPNTTTSIICPAGYYCPLGSQAPIECLVASSCAEGSSQRSLSVYLPISLFLVLSVLTGVASCVVDRLMHRKQVRLDARASSAGSVTGTLSDIASKEGDEDGDDDGVDVHKSRASASSNGAVALNGAAGAGASIARRPEAKGLVFRNLTVEVKHGGPMILTNCSGTIQPGRLTALMGNSGCGKSSLLNVLSRRAYYARVRSGEVHVLPAGAHKPLVGYVPQEDIYHRALTVREIFEFQARLRLPHSWSEQARETLIEETLDLLKLRRVQHRVVGGEGGGRTAISGGQSRRVSIGMELMANPDILALDEPTSGLDANASFAILSSLQLESRRNNLTVVCVIHQPRCEIFRAFDRILLLAEGGRTCYDGSQAAVASYFEQLGFTSTSAINPADFVVDALNSSEVVVDLPSVWATADHARYDVAPNHDHHHPGASDSKLTKETSIECGSDTSDGRDGRSSAQPQTATAPGDDEALEVVSAYLDVGGADSNKGAIEAPMDQEQQGEAVPATTAEVGLEMLPLEGNNHHDDAKGSQPQQSRRRSSRLLASAGWVSSASFDSDLHHVDKIGHTADLPGWWAALCLHLWRSSLFAYHRLKEVVFDHVYVGLASLLLGAVTRNPDFIQLSAAFAMVALLLGVMSTATFLRVFSREERAFWRERASGIAPGPFILANMLVDLVPITTFSVLSSGIIYATFAPLMQYRIVWQMCWGLLFSFSGLAYFVSGCAPRSSGGLVVVGLVGIMVLLSGVSPTIHQLDEMGAIGKILSSLSTSRWFCESLTVAERDANNVVLHYAYDNILFYNGYRYGVDTALPVLVALGMGWRLLCVVFFLLIRRSCL